MDNYEGSADRAFRKLLRDDAYREEYVNSVIEDVTDGEIDQKDVLAALIGCIKDIVYTHGSVDRFIRETGVKVDRQVFYNMFKYLEDSTGRRGPEFVHILDILSACGLTIRVASKDQSLASP